MKKKLLIIIINKLKYNGLSGQHKFKIRKINSGRLEENKEKDKGYVKKTNKKLNKEKVPNKRKMIKKVTILKSQKDQK